VVSDVAATNQPQEGHPETWELHSVAPGANQVRQPEREEKQECSPILMSPQH
jgi:hypothetical protein